MARRYTYEATLSWGGDEPTAELEVKATYSVAWGSPASGNYGPPENYDPGAADEVEDIRIETVNGKPGPWDLSYGYQTAAEDIATLIDKLVMDHEEAMICEAIEIEAGDEPDPYTEAKDRALERALANGRGA